MNNNEDKTITGHLLDLREVVNRLVPMLQSQRLREDMLQSDIDIMKDELKKVELQVESMKQLAESNREIAQKILDTAKERANEFIESAKERNLKSIELMNKVEGLVLEADKKEYQRLKSQLNAEIKS